MEPIQSEIFPFSHVYRIWFMWDNLNNLKLNGISIESASFRDKKNLGFAKSDKLPLLMA